MVRILRLSGVHRPFRFGCVVILGTHFHPHLQEMQSDRERWLLISFLLDKICTHLQHKR